MKRIWILSNSVRTLMHTPSRLCLEQLCFVKSIKCPLSSVCLNSILATCATRFTSKMNEQWNPGFYLIDRSWESDQRKEQRTDRYRSRPRSSSLPSELTSASISSALHPQITKQATTDRLRRSWSSVYQSCLQFGNFQLQISAHRRAVLTEVVVPFP